jgi:hypothetical protein
MPYGPTEARLRPRDDLALEEHHVGDRHQRRVEDDDDLQERDDEGVDDSRHTRH